MEASAKVDATTSGLLTLFPRRFHPGITLSVTGALAGTVVVVVLAVDVVVVAVLVVVVAAELLVVVVEVVVVADATPQLEQ